MNLYTYVRNNPLRYNDPTGHDGGDILWGAVWTGIGIAVDVIGSAIGAAMVEKAPSSPVIETPIQTEYPEIYVTPPVVQQGETVTQTTFGEQTPTVISTPIQNQTPTIITTPMIGQTLPTATISGSQDLIGVKTSNGKEITRVSNHALQRMTERNITSDAVKGALTDPDATYPGNKPATECYQKGNIRVVVGNDGTIVSTIVLGGTN